MSTATAEPETETTPTPAAATGFRFDGPRGECTNPEKVAVKVGELGAACSLLVARNPEGRWWAGYQLGGRNLAYVTLTPGAAGAGGTRIGFGTREEALRHGATLALYWTHGLHAVPAAVAIAAALKKQFAVEDQLAPQPPADDWTPAPNASGFQFDTDGHCTNPERIEIPCAPGHQCALLVAQQGDGGWTFGAIRAGVGEDLFKYPAQLIANGEQTREEAIETALIIALEAGEPGSAINRALETWRATRADAHTREAEAQINKSPSRKERIEQIRAGVKKGLTALEIASETGLGMRDVSRILEKLEFHGPGPWDNATPATPAPAPASEKLTREHVLEYFADADQTPNEAQIAYWMEHGARYERLQSQLATLDAAPKPENDVENAIRAEQIAGVSHEMGVIENGVTALQTPSTPAAETAAPVLPGLAHAVNEHGVFTTSESVTVAMPKKAQCKILLACAPSGRWACGTDLRLPTAGQSHGPFINDATHETRAAALDAGLVDAKAFFEDNRALSATEKKLADRCGEAVMRFRDEFRDKFLTGDTAPAAPAAPRVAPSYRTEFAELAVSKIQENPNNHRKHFNALAVRELADSLLSEGLHQPIAVRKLLPEEKPEGELPLGDPGAPEYELIFGHRRRRAALIAGLATLQAKIYHGLTRRQAIAIALIENLQRENINAMEEAEGYAQLMEDEALTQEACADRVGRPRSTVANAVRLLRLPARVRDAIRDGALNAEHGKGLVRFVPKTEDDAEQFPKWDLVLAVMTEQAILQKIPSAALEKGVPFIRELTAAGLAVRIDQFGPHRLGARQREHPAYFQSGDGDWICFAPDHWKTELADRERKEKERAESERQAREAELAKLAKSGRKQLKLAELNPDDYREFSGAHAPLLSLVPDHKKTAAKGDAGRTTVVTDVQLAERLQKAMMREIRKNRESAVITLEEKIRKKIAGIKQVGPRELAWMVYLIADNADRSVRLHLTPDAAKSAGVKLAPAAYAADEFDFTERPESFAQKRLAGLAKCEGAHLVRTLIAERMPVALAEIVAGGPESLGARFVQWWLDTDTLWLLEETEEGREQLVDAVKLSPWYAKTIAGENAEVES